MREPSNEEKGEVGDILLLGTIIICIVLFAISQIIIWHGDKITWF